MFIRYDYSDLYDTGEFTQVAGFCMTELWGFESTAYEANGFMDDYGNFIQV